MATTFSSLSKQLLETFKNLRSKGKLSPADIDGTLRQIRRALLDGDVALEVVKTFIASVRQRALSDEVNKALNPAQQVVKIVDEELTKLFGGQVRRLQMAKTGTTVFMLAGLQGAGKTSVAAKLGKWLKDEGQTPLLAACDLQRPNAVGQLKTLAAAAKLPVFAPEPGNGVGDPVAVAKLALKEATRQQNTVLIVDTAGRLGVDQEMMDQAAKIKKVISPHEVFFVMDSMTGQDAVNTARAFLAGVDFTGAILTKLDGDARGGAALSVVSVTDRPILFSSTGEGLDDFEAFYPDRMSRRILDMGDVLTVIEQAQKIFDQKKAEELAKKIAADTLTLEDFLEQMRQLKNMGSIQKMLGMLPGASQFREQIENFDPRQIDVMEAIICSMTALERKNVRILNGSRRLRIARGSGTTVREVNDLVSRFEQASKVMKNVKGGRRSRVPGLPLGGLPLPRPKVKKKARGRVARSGNPAVRAGVLPPKPSDSGSSFGL